MIYTFHISNRGELMKVLNDFRAYTLVLVKNGETLPLQKDVVSTILSSVQQYSDYPIDLILSVQNDQLAYIYVYLEKDYNLEYTKDEVLQSFKKGFETGEEYMKELIQVLLQNENLTSENKRIYINDEAEDFIDNL